MLLRFYCKSLRGYSIHVCVANTNKVWCKKKLQNLNNNFGTNIYSSLKFFVSQKLQIFSPFQRGALHKCSLTIGETKEISVKFVRN